MRRRRTGLKGGAQRKREKGGEKINGKGGRISSNPQSERQVSASLTEKGAGNVRRGVAAAEKSFQGEKVI